MLALAVDHNRHTRVAVINSTLHVTPDSSALVPIKWCAGCFVPLKKKKKVICCCCSSSISFLLLLPLPFLFSAVNVCLLLLISDSVAICCCCSSSISFLLLLPLPFLFSGFVLFFNHFDLIRYLLMLFFFFSSP